MSGTDDRLSRIMALRPTVRRSAENTAGRQSGAAERLAEILCADIRTTQRGSHLVVYRSLQTPAGCAITPEAARSLAPWAEDAGDPCKWLFLDTETTGLAGGTGTYPFLVGLAWWENGLLTLEQLFMRDHCEEPSLLASLSERLASRPVLVTFNGKCFDWPLLETRYRLNRMKPERMPSAHLDLLHPARQLWRFRLRSVALSELERHVLGLERGHDIPSHTIPQRYFDFLRGGPPEPVAEVFRHNELDLVGLAALSVRIAAMIAEPETTPCDGTEFYGLSRLMQRRGETESAGRLFERALDTGLPPQVDRSARRELALILKRAGDHNRANSLWNDLAGDSPGGMEAYEQLAIFHEHRAHDARQAAVMTRNALVSLREAAQAGRLSPQQYRNWHAKLQHRLNRLQKQLG
jgi:uncharacterized protein